MSVTNAAQFTRLSMDQMLRPVCRQELAFDYVSIPRRSGSGVPYAKIVEVGMPRIPDDHLRCVFYLYPSRDAAERGVKHGGTGFLVMHGMPPRLYAITNHHVAVRSGCSVIRIMAASNQAVTIELDPTDWEFLPGRADVAAVDLTTDHSRNQIPFFPRQGFPYLRAVASSDFALANTIVSEHIGPGEDVYMIGRFLDHDGVDLNMPAVRFGHISTMAAHIRQRDNYTGECYTIDMHSRSGFSGSPVFAFRTFGQDLVDGGIPRLRKPFSNEHSILNYKPVFRLLGIHCGQFPESMPITRMQTEESSYGKEYVQGLSGMTIVVPAWDILELLNIPKFAVQREHDEAEFRRQRGLPIPEAKPPDRRQ